MIGIYKIENKVNGKIYIGQSNNITRRWHEHVKALFDSTHHSWKLQEDFNSYGILNFSFEVLRLCNKSELDILEEKYIEQFNALFDGYNVMGENGVLDSSQIMKENGRYIIDINALFNDVNDYALVIRFIRLYVSLASIGNRISLRNKINNVSSLKRYLNLSDRESSSTITKLKEHGLIIKDESETGFRFNDKYIKKVYSIKKQDIDLFLIYKYKFNEIYKSVAPSEHKQLGYLLRLCDLFNNPIANSSYKDIKNAITEFGIYDMSNPNRFLNKILSIDTPFGKLISIDDVTNDITLNTAIYQPCVSLQNKISIENTFKEMV